MARSGTATSQRCGEAVPPGPRLPHVTSLCSTLKAARSPVDPITYRSSRSGSAGPPVSMSMKWSPKLSRSKTIVPPSAANRPSRNATWILVSSTTIVGQFDRGAKNGVRRSGSRHVGGRPVDRHRPARGRRQHHGEDERPAFSSDMSRRVDRQHRPGRISLCAQGRSQDRTPMAHYQARGPFLLVLVHRHLGIRRSETGQYPGHHLVGEHRRPWPWWSSL